MICYSRHCVETIMNLVFDGTKVKWFALYHTNLSHKVPLSFVWLNFSCFGWDVDMMRIRSDKTLILGIPKAPQVNIQAIKLGDAPEGIPSFVFNIIGNITWRYVFIRHMIWVLLGASFYFVRICLLLFIIMFWIFYFNKSGNDSLYYAYFASLHVAVWKQKVFYYCLNSSGKSERDKILKFLQNKLW